MLIACEICNERSETGAKSVRRFATTRSLRAHLVDAHSKFVARALLEPNLSDRVHFWILANVDYSAATQLSDGENQSKIHHNENGVLPAKRKFSAEIAANGATDYTEIQLNNKGNLRSHTPNDYDDNGSTSRHTVHASGSKSAAESKAMRKTECKVCQIAICATARQRHVYMIHLRQRDLFRCSACGYTNSNSIWELRKHCASQHTQSGAKAISNEEKYADLIQDWNQQCFPDWKQKSWPGDDKNSANELSMIESCVDAEDKFVDADDKDVPQPLASAFAVDWTQLAALAESAVTSAKRPRHGNPGRSTVVMATADPEIIRAGDSSIALSAKTKVPVVANSGSGGSSTAMSSNDRICHVCWEESRYPGRHIAQKHLSHHLYECPFGDGFGSYESCAVVKHIRKVHGGQPPDITPTNNVERLVDEIMDLQKRCFPNRPIKLLRGYISEKMADNA